MEEYCGKFKFIFDTKWVSFCPSKLISFSFLQKDSLRACHVPGTSVGCSNKKIRTLLS